MSEVDAAEIVAMAARRWAQTHMAAMGPRLVALIVKDSGDLSVPATSTREDEPLIDRLDSGAPLTPLSDPETGQGHLGAWGQQPSSVGDLLSARGTDGRRVAAALERLCAMEAARGAPPLTDQLARDHPGLAEQLAGLRATAPFEPGTVNVDAVLCAEVAALSAIELLVGAYQQLRDVPVKPSSRRV